MKSKAIASLNEHKNTIVNVVAVAMLMLGGALRGEFENRWFGNLLGYGVYSVAFLLWSHNGKHFWPEGGAPEWEKFRRAGFIRYTARWVLLGLFITVTLAPIFYVLHLIFDGPSRTASLLNYIKLSLMMGVTLGVLVGVWAWIDCQFIYRATRSKSSADAATEHQPVEP